MRHTLIQLNSLSITYPEFETVVWNQTHLDDIRKRNYTTDLDAKSSDIISFLNNHIEPVFLIDRWVSNVYEADKTFNYAMFWLNIFLKNDVTVIYPKYSSNVKFVDKIRQNNPAIYATLIKNLHNI